MTILSFRNPISNMAAALAVLCLFSSLSLEAAEARAAGPGTPNPKSIKYPDGHPPSEAEVELGKKLFFDTRLSFNGKFSCGTCHDPEKGFADGKALSKGATDKTLPRHTPHLFNLAWNKTYFWDGRAKSLEEQALMPIQAPDEMNSKLDDVLAKLKAVPAYVTEFNRAYPKKGISAVSLAKALAAFERTLISNDSPFDRYLAGDTAALNPQAANGMRLFFGHAQCNTCHSGANFTDHIFHNTGVPGTDLGRANIDRVGEFQMRPYPFFQMQRAFKTPSLRNVALSAPYLHDGSEATLRDVVKFYNQGGKDKQSAGLSPDVHPLNLKESEIDDLVAFLEALTSPVPFTRPIVP